MMLLKRLFQHPDKHDRELHGLAEAPVQADQDAVRVRMETEVTRGKARRAAMAAANGPKAPPSSPKV